MQAIIFIGIQAPGKSTFFQQRFSPSHLRLSLNRLKTRHREQLLLCLGEGENDACSDLPWLRKDGAASIETGFAGMPNLLKLAIG